MNKIIYPIIQKMLRKIVINYINAYIVIYKNVFFLWMLSDGDHMYLILDDSICSFWADLESMAHSLDISFA